MDKHQTHGNLDEQWVKHMLLNEDHFLKGEQSESSKFSAFKKYVLQNFAITLSRCVDLESKLNGGSC